MTNKLCCSYCEKEFKYESEKKRHELSHSPRFVCKICNKKFSFVSALKRHEKQHQRTERVPCTQCNRSFRDESLLKRHVKYAHKGNYTCSKCNTEFHSELALNTHKKIHTSKAERKYHCSYNGCEKTFNFPHHLKHHELTHTNVKQHYCQICLKGFIQSHHLKSHMKTHEPEKWLCCIESNCDKKFPTEYSRKRHVFNAHNIKLEDISTSESSQDGCDFKFDTILCTSCGEIVDLLLHDEHQSKCSLVCNDYLNDLFDGGQKNPNKEVTQNTNINCSSKDLKNSKSVLGMYNENSTNIQPNLVQFEPYRINESVNTGCENCECGRSIMQYNNIGTANGIGNFERQNIPNRNNCARNPDSYMPNIEYKIDGSIKLKETFDSDINIFENKRVENIEEDKIYETFKSNIATNLKWDIPFNSCRDVIGKCIVSGSNTISEECLCAKMVAEEQQMTAEEIDEITPKPAASYMSIPVI